MYAILKAMIISSLGNLIEWYDIGLFSAFSVLFAHAFFPNSSPSIAIVEVFGVYALGFLCRPLGGLLFGYFGDRLGRAKALRASILMISLPTMLVAIVPTYQSIGLFAPICLMLLRVLQGISLGGEFTGIIVYLTETAPLKRRALTASLAGVVANIGILAANGMALLLESLLSPSAFESYGWRIAFAVGGLMGMLILYWRRGLLETPAFLLLKAKSQIINAPFTAALRQVPGKMLLTISLVMLGAVLYYTCFIYLTTLLQQLGLSQSRIYLLQTTCLAAMIVLVPMGGWLCDIIGRKLSFLIISSGALLFTWPCFHWLASGHLSLIILALAIFTLLSSMEQGSTSATTAELFPTAMRYTGLSFSYNLTQALFGGTAPVVAASLVMLTHEPTAPSYYLIAIAAITFVCSLCFLSTKPAQSFS